MTDRTPGLSRRDFLRLGLVAPASLVAACGWDGGPILEPRLRAISRLNDWVGEKILLSPTRLAREYPVAARTAGRAVPGVLHHGEPHRTVSDCRRTAASGRSRWAGWSARRRGSRRHDARGSFRG